MALLLQATSISGSLEMPVGMPPPPTAQVVLLPVEYARLFNAEAQQRLDDYWENFKPEFSRQKELFLQVMPLAYTAALETTLSQMRRDNKLNISGLIKNATGGRFEFRGVAPGEYKLIATASIRGKDYVWTEALQVKSAPLTIQMKTHVP